MPPIHGSIMYGRTSFISEHWISNLGHISNGQHQPAGYVPTRPSSADDRGCSTSCLGSSTLGNSSVTMASCSELAGSVLSPGSNLHSWVWHVTVSIVIVRVSQRGYLLGIKSRRIVFACSMPQGVFEVSVQGRL